MCVREKRCAVLPSSMYCSCKEPNGLAKHNLERTGQTDSKIANYRNREKKKKRCVRKTRKGKVDRWMDGRAGQRGEGDHPKVTSPEVTQGPFSLAPVPQPGQLNWPGAGHFSHTHHRTPPHTTSIQVHNNHTILDRD